MKQYPYIPYILYLTLSILYSISIVYMSRAISLTNPDFGNVYFYVSTVANFGFLSTHFCPFKIFSRWLYNRNYNLLQYLRRAYKLQGRWKLAVIIYLPAIIVTILGIFYLLIR